MTQPTVLVIAGSVLVVYATVPAAAAFLTQQVSWGAVVTAFSMAAASEAGSATTTYLLTTGLLTAAVVGGLQTFNNPLTLGILNGEIDPGTGEEHVTVIIDDAIDINTFLDNNTSVGDGQQERNQLENVIRFAVAECARQMTEPLAQTIATQFGVRNPSAQVQADGKEIIVDGVRSHACSLVPFYIPGAGNHTSGVPIASATSHISHVLYDTELVEWAPGNYANHQPPVPRQEWFFLNRRDPTAAGGWYSAGTTYDCQGVWRQTSCDEFPARATLQGGDPGPGAEGTPAQPHLAIIGFDHNSVQGSDQNWFYEHSGCNVNDGDLFVIVPMPLEVLGLADLGPGLVTDRLRSQHICKSYP